jgi:hypothetical protein
LGGKKEDMHPGYHRNILVSSLLFFSLLKLSYSQQLNYREIFGDDWKKAEAFVDDNRIWMQPLLEENNISYPLAIAVIFPELVRYSALRDKMETSMLKILYINLGEEYANFSIGHFQMKPSFAEAIREKALAALERRSGLGFSRKDDFDDIVQFRKSIVKDLEDTRIQLNYLIAFMKICEHEYNLKRMDESDRVRFLSTVYNYGLGKSVEEIEGMTERKFYNTKLFSNEHYSYADVALFWYNVR